MVIIAPDGFRKPLEYLEAERTREGVLSKFIPIEDIYDEFNDGIVSAEAIRDFLQYARLNWEMRPDFVILGGDSSSDPRNYSGLAGRIQNPVPTMFTDTWNIEAPSDEMLVDFNGDSLGELAVGRLPGINRSELEAMFSKIQAASSLTAADVRERGVHFVSDDFLGYNFAAASRSMAASLPVPVAVNYLDRTNQDATVLRNELIRRINAGPVAVNYFGHGSVTSWTSAGILRNVDAARLSAPKRPSFFVALACLNGDNTVFGTTGLAESMMKRESGGAFAMWAASGWNGAYEEELMGRDLYQRLFSGMTLGEAVREVKSRYPTVDMRRTFILFGDPSFGMPVVQN
jgi:hypothetical protein